MKNDMYLYFYQAKHHNLRLRLSTPFETHDNDTLGESTGQKKTRQLHYLNTLAPKGSITSSCNFRSVKFRLICYHLWRFQEDAMERLAIISHNFFRAIGFQTIRSPSSPNGPSPQGSQLITLGGRAGRGNRQLRI